MNSSGEDHYYLVNSRDETARFEIKPDDNIISKKDLAKLKIEDTAIGRLQIKKQCDAAITIKARYKPFVSIQMHNNAFDIIKIHDFQDSTMIIKEIKQGERFVVSSLEKFIMFLESESFMLQSYK